MNTNYLKDPLYAKLPAAIQKKIVDATQLQGKALTCHVTAVEGALITVQFDLNDIYTLPQVTIPLFGPEYIRYPIRQGDLGVCMPVDVSISYTSGQGGGTPDLSDPASLEALYFMPIGNKNWVTVDPTAVTAYAPNGVTLRDTNSGAVITLHPSSITIVVGGTSFDLDGSSITATTQTFTVNAPTIVLNGNLTQGTSGSGYPATLQGPVTVIHDVTAAGTSVHGHIHSGVQSGGSDTGPPV